MTILDLLQQDRILFLSAVGIFSLLIGSFLNVVIHRIPIMLNQGWRHDCLEFLSENNPNTPETNNAAVQKYTLVAPRSACPSCGHMITAVENIPVLSYLFLGGKCSQCKTKISLRYPFVEILCAILSVTVAWYYGVSIQTIVALLLTWNLLALSFIDYDHKLLPDQMTLPFIWLGLLINMQGLFTDLQSAVIGASVGYLSLWSIYHVFKIITKKEGMGYGDFKLLAVFGAWLGWQALPTIIIFSSVAGAIVGISLIVLKLQDKSKPIPFGPFLAIAGWIAMLWNDEIIGYYLMVNKF